MAGAEGKNKGGRPRIPEETRDLVARLYNEDKPIEYIAKACRVSERTVFAIMKERREKQNGR